MKGGMTYRQREIVLIPFPYSDLSGSKKRPALIISNNKINKSEDLVCCLVTSKKPKKGLAVGKQDVEKGGLPFESWVKPYRIFSIDKRIIKKKLCLINKGFHDRILREINVYLVGY